METFLYIAFLFTLYFLIFFILNENFGGVMPNNRKVRFILSLIWPVTLIVMAIISIVVYIVMEILDIFFSPKEEDKYDEHL